MSDTAEPNPATMRLLVAILWPSFIVAGVAATFVFALFDVRQLLAETRFNALKPLAIYSIGFFMLWLATAASAALACYFVRPADSTAR